MLRDLRPDAFNEGLDNNSLAKYAAEHWYQYDGSATGTLNLQGIALVTTTSNETLRPLMLST